MWVLLVVNRLYFRNIVTLGRQTPCIRVRGCVCIVPFFVRGSGWSWSWVGVWGEEDGHEGSAVRGALRSHCECDHQQGERVCEGAPKGR